MTFFQQRKQTKKMKWIYNLIRLSPYSSFSSISSIHFLNAEFSIELKQNRTFDTVNLISSGTLYYCMCVNVEWLESRHSGLSLPVLYKRQLKYIVNESVVRFNSDEIVSLAIIYLHNAHSICFRIWRTKKKKLSETKTKRNVKTKRKFCSTMCA